MTAKGFEQETYTVLEIKKYRKREKGKTERKRTEEFSEDDEAALAASMVGHGRLIGCGSMTAASLGVWVRNMGMGMGMGT